MKKTTATVMGFIVGIMLLGISACSKSGEGVDTSKVQDVNGSKAQALDTTKLQSAFQTAPEADKAEAQNAVTAVKSGNYARALASLQKVAKSANLTPEQKSAVQDLVSQVQAKGLGLGNKAMGAAGDTVNQAGQGAGKAGEDLQKSVPK